jgi:hypothetical protein
MFLAATPCCYVVWLVHASVCGYQAVKANTGLVPAVSQLSST